MASSWAPKSRWDNHGCEATHVSYRPGAPFRRLLWAVTAACVYRHVAALVPSVIDVCCRSNVMITTAEIRKVYEGHARHVFLWALGSYPDFSKVFIVVDERVDIYDLDDVMWAYMTRGRAATRAMILSDAPGICRDPKKDHWGRLRIDATVRRGRVRARVHHRAGRGQSGRLAGMIANDRTDGLDAALWQYMQRV